MRPLSATEGIGPALERTQDFWPVHSVWARFSRSPPSPSSPRWAEVSIFNVPGRSNGMHELPPAFLAFLVAFAVMIGLVSLVIGLILFYIGSRLQLVLLELVATRYTLVAPLWRKYGSRTWRWIGLKLLFFLCILLVLLPFTIPAILYFVHHAHEAGAGVADFFSGLHIAQILLFVAVA